MHRIYSLVGAKRPSLVHLAPAAGQDAQLQKKKKEDLYTTFLANVILNVHVRYMLSAVRLSVVCL